MKLMYDHKTSGLLIEVDKLELKDIAAKLCNEFDSNHLLDQEIGHITYQLKYESDQNDINMSLIFASVYGILCSILGLLIIPLGVYKAYEIIISWIY